MRILTWNVGIFSWFKYAPYLNLKLEGKPIQHQYFQVAHAQYVIATIRNIQPQIVVLQEFYTPEDRECITEELRDLYPYSKEIGTWYHKHNILVLSFSPIITDHLGTSEFHSLQTGGVGIVPIHLNSFSAKKRLNQIKGLISELRKKELKQVCVLGDTNFWDVAGKNWFLFKADSLAYHLLTENLKDCTENLGATSKVGVGLDKIFITHDLSCIKSTCLKRNAKYMDHFPVVTEIQ